MRADRDPETIRAATDGSGSGNGEREHKHEHGAVVGGEEATAEAEGTAAQAPRVTRLHQQQPGQRCVQPPRGALVRVCLKLR